jgi:hypothetical protein
MWVYWLTLAVVATLLYFTCNKFFSRNITGLSIAVTIILGALYPLLINKFFLWQVAVIFIYFLAFMAVLIVKRTDYFFREHNCTEASTQHKISQSADITDTNKELEPSIIKPLVEENTPAELTVAFEIENSSIDYNDKIVEILEPETTQEDNRINELLVNSVKNSLTEELPGSLNHEHTNDLWDKIEEKFIDLFDNYILDDLYREIKLSIGNIINPGQAESHDDGTVESKDEISDTTDLLIEGMRLVKLKFYPEAIRNFHKVINSDSGPDQLYLAVAELSTVYQNLGLYKPASDIISILIEHPKLQNHPGKAILEQKLKFILSLLSLLETNNLGYISYEQVPDKIRSKAYANSLL